MSIASTGYFHPDGTVAPPITFDSQAQVERIIRLAYLGPMGVPNPALGSPVSLNRGDGAQWVTDAMPMWWGNYEWIMTAIAADRTNYPNG